MSKKTKLLLRLLSKPKDFTWKEAVSLMSGHNFKVVKSDGSRRSFVHVNGTKVMLHEPHPEPVLKPYMIERLIEGLLNAGEISESDL